MCSSIALFMCSSIAFVATISFFLKFTLFKQPRCKTDLQASDLPDGQWAAVHVMPFCARCHSATQWVTYAIPTAMWTWIVRAPCRTQPAIRWIWETMPTTTARARSSCRCTIMRWQPEPVCRPARDTLVVKVTDRTIMGGQWTEVVADGSSSRSNSSATFLTAWRMPPLQVTRWLAGRWLLGKQGWNSAHSLHRLALASNREHHACTRAVKKFAQPPRLPWKTLFTWHPSHHHQAHTSLLLTTGLVEIQYCLIHAALWGFLPTGTVFQSSMWFVCIAGILNCVVLFSLQWGELQREDSKRSATHVRRWQADGVAVKFDQVQWARV